MIEATCFLSSLVNKEEDFSSETFETFTRDLSQFLASIGRNLLQLFLELNQPSDNQLEHKGRKYFHKKTEDRKYATLFGEITVSRRVYFNMETRKSLVPLDKSLRMEKQFATAEIRNRIKAHPWAMIFSVSQNDWYNYCTCANCKKLADYINL